MVASIGCMKGSPAQIASYYTAETAWEYYAGAEHGTWIGGAARAAGVLGAVTRTQLQNLLCGLNADGGQLVKRIPIKPNSKQRSRCGYDVTFSVPKSVSVLWSASNDHDRSLIEQATRTAVESTLATLEEMVPLARRGKGGTQSMAAKLVAGIFLHTISRDLDPQLHVHATVMNMCHGEDGRWSAVDSRKLHQWTPTLGRIFRCNLAHELKANLGVELHRPEQANGKTASWFEIKGISQGLMDAWSSRRKKIIETIEGSGNLGNSAAKARQQANLKTREKKPENIDKQELQDAWKREAAKYGLNETSIENMKGRSQTPRKDLYEEAFETSIERLTEHKAHFSPRELVQEVCEHLQHHGVDGGEVTKRVLEDVKQSPLLVPLSEQHRGEDQLTSEKMWKLEEKLLGDVAAMQERGGVHLTSDQAADVLDQHRSLSEEQRLAAIQLLTDDRGVKLLTGVAGAGKSYTLNAVRDGLEKQGFRVIGGAISGAAKEELVRQTGMESRTVASYLYRLEEARKLTAQARHHLKQLGRAALGKPTHKLPTEQLNSRTAIILDEAAVIDTRSMERLVHHVKQAGATLILAGDACQLSPIRAGNPTPHLASKHGSASLETNRRQQEKEDRQSVHDIRVGKAREALKSYADRGRITVAADKTEAAEKLVTAWSAAGGHREPKKHVIFTQTRAEAHDLNKRCQRERLKSLGCLPGLSVTCGKERIYLGDRVLFHKPLRSRFIENGYRGKVIGIDPIRRQVSVWLDQEPSRQARLQGASRLTQVPLKELGNDGLTLGYAATTHKMQGQTAEHSYLFLGGKMTDREMAYVQTTRAKFRTNIFVDEAHAGEDLEDLARSVAKSNAKRMAHDFGRKRQVRQQLELRPEITHSSLGSTP